MIIKSFLRELKNVFSIEAKRRWKLEGKVIYFGSIFFSIIDETLKKKTGCNLVCPLGIFNSKSKNMIFFGWIHTISFCLGLCVGSKLAGTASANEGTAGSEPDGVQELGESLVRECWTTIESILSQFHEQPYFSSELTWFSWLQ